MKKIDITGQRFERLVVIRRDGTKYGQSAWLCRCDCGNEKTIALQHLRNGTRSCGCLSKEVAPERGHKSHIGERTRKHGDFGTKLYGVWAAMKRRCYNQNSRYYKEYGGRGIIVCDEWKDTYSSFKEWALANGYKEGVSVDRINTNGNYEPANCRWVSMKEQQNNRRNNTKLLYRGQEYTLRELSDMSGISYRTLKGRHDRGWITDNILDPVMHVNKYR